MRADSGNNRTCGSSIALAADIPGMGTPAGSRDIFFAHPERFDPFMAKFPARNLAVLIGSTLWLVWLVVPGVYWSRKGLAPAE